MLHLAIYRCNVMYTGASSYSTEVWHLGTKIQRW